jgi:hypothetical protein
LKHVAEPYQALVKQHLPAGYKLVCKKLSGGTAAYAIFTREIRIDHIKDREQLFIFFHEAGHVHCGHLRKANEKSGPHNWRDEYEADQYAITAMKAAGVAVPRGILIHHKKCVREIIEAARHSDRAPDHCDDDAVLRYAYGREWKKHR